MALKEPGLRGSLRNTGSVTPAFFDVNITNTNSPVQEGDILTVDYSADNTGDAQDMQDIRLEIDSVQEDVDPDVMLAGGASTTGTLEWDTTGEPEAEYTATVLSNDDSDSVIVEIGSAIPDIVLLPEDNDLDNFTGDTNNFSIETSPTITTDRCLQYSGQNDSDERIISQSGLNRYPARGEQFSLYVNTDDNGPRPRLLFGVENSDNYYQISLFPDISNDQLRLLRVEDGSSTTLAEDDANINESAWFEIEVDWQESNDITVRAYEVDQDNGSRQQMLNEISANDGTYSDETGIGLETGSANGVASISDWRITDIL